MRIASARVPGTERALTFAVHERNDRHVSERIAAEGIWEPFETEIVRRLLLHPVPGSPDSRHLFVDCGANLGWYSVVAGSLGADVVAFEPLPANAALLTYNIAVNDLGGSVEVHETALGSGAGTGTLGLSVDNQGDHRMAPVDGAERASRREEVAVPVRRLDDVLRGRAPTVIKLDTQGSEVAILRGGTVSWTRPDVVVIIEFWPYGLACCGSSAAELLDLLGGLIGVTHDCFEVVEWRNQLVPLTMDELTAMALTGGYSAAMKGFTNLVLLPSASLGAVRDLIGAPTPAT